METDIADRVPNQTRAKTHSSRKSCMLQFENCCNCYASCVMSFLVSGALVLTFTQFSLGAIVPAPSQVHTDTTEGRSVRRWSHSRERASAHVPRVTCAMCLCETHTSLRARVVHVPIVPLTHSLSVLMKKEPHFFLLVSLLALFSASRLLYFHMKMVHYLQNPNQMTKFT